MIKYAVIALVATIFLFLWTVTLYSIHLFIESLPVEVEWAEQLIDIILLMLLLAFIIVLVIEADEATRDSIR